MKGFDKRSCGDCTEGNEPCEGSLSECQDEETQAQREARMDALFPVTPEVPESAGEAEG